MPTFIVSVKLLDGGFNDYRELDAAMENENFILHKPALQNHREFFYYGNLRLSDAQEIVQRTVVTMKKQCSFTVMNDSRAERQYHTMQRI